MWVARCLLCRGPWGNRQSLLRGRVVCCLCHFQAKPLEHCDRVGKCRVPYKGFMGQWLGGEGRRLVSALRHTWDLLVLEASLSGDPVASGDGGRWE